MRDVIRKNAGSPFTDYQFSMFNNSGSLCDSLFGHNLGSNTTYVWFVSGTPGLGSTAMLLPPGASFHLDIKVGSVQIYSSGANTASEFQLIGLGI